MFDSILAARTDRNREVTSTAPVNSAKPSGADDVKMGALLGWLWAFALMVLLAFDVWAQANKSAVGENYFPVVWGPLLALTIGGPWLLMRNWAAARRLRVMPIAVACYLAASLLVSGWSTQGRFAVLLFFAAGLAGCAGMIIAIASSRGQSERGEHLRSGAIVGSSTPR